MSKELTAKPHFRWVSDDNVALLTDMYELTMAASYFRNGINGTATFDLFVRNLPEHRSFLVAAGLEDALHYLETLRFTEPGLAYLRSVGGFEEPFLDFLGELQFTGDVRAVPEGEVVFQDEPILSVTAPLIEAQIVETFLLNCIGYQTVVATKAARVDVACDGRAFVDFAARRAHAADAAMKCARASYIGGAVATSNVLAAQAYGIPPSGTMAHSYVMSFEHEADAFRTYARDFPRGAILLIDTYDTVEGARRAAQVANELASEGISIRAVRLDSGDLGALSKKVRAILDEAGLPNVQVFASGDLDEYRITDLLRSGAPIDAFGVGTQLGVSADAPALGGVYKLVEDEHGPKMKLSAGKVTLPGRKQVYRFEDDGVAVRDVLALESEPEPDGGRPLLHEVMRGGKRTREPEALEAMRKRRALAVASLPEHTRTLADEVERFPVVHSTELDALVNRVKHDIAG